MDSILDVSVISIAASETGKGHQVRPDKRQQTSSRQAAGILRSEISPALMSHFLACG